VSHAQQPLVQTTGSPTSASEVIMEIDVENFQISKVFFENRRFPENG